MLRAHCELKAQGYGLITHDGYRPWYVTKIFWDATPDDKKIFVANPAEGSKHNRGCAVDLSLYDLKTGKEVKMPSGYDEMTDRAFSDYAGGTADERTRCEPLCWNGGSHSPPLLCDEFQDGQSNSPVLV